MGLRQIQQLCRYTILIYSWLTMVIINYMKWDVHTKGFWVMVGINFILILSDFLWSLK